MFILIVSTARSAPSSNSVINHRLTPDEYRSIPDQHEETNTDLNDQNADAVPAFATDDDYSVDESQDSICEQAMNMIIQHHDISNLDPSILLHYCPQYDQRLAWIQQNHDQLLKGRFTQKQSASSTPIDHDKRRGLRRRQLNKRVALRFIGKQMS